LEVNLDDLERRAIGDLLTERMARLFEIVGDTTRAPRLRSAAARERILLTSLLRKLRAHDRRLKHGLDEDEAAKPASASGAVAEPRR
jgi:hypothetical protein